MTTKPILILALGSVLTVAGCETYERDPISKAEVKVEDKDPNEDERYDEYRERAEENPDDPRGWYALGEYCEQSRYSELALDAYFRMQAALDKQDSNQSFTGGYFRIARVYLRSLKYAEAETYFNKVLELQPKSIHRASLNPNFRESHLYLGAVYAYHKQWKRAQQHILEFKQLGGGNQGDHILIQADDALYRRGGERSVESSYEDPNKGSESKPRPKKKPVNKSE